MAQFAPILCKCGLRAVARTSKTSEHPGKVFHGCPYFKVRRECDFFVWESDKIHGELLNRVHELEISKVALEKQNHSMNMKLKEFELQLADVEYESGEMRKHIVEMKEIQVMMLKELKKKTSCNCNHKCATPKSLTMLEIIVVIVVVFILLKLF